MQRWITQLSVIALMLALMGLIPVQAQENLLTSPGFETNYSGRTGRGDFNFPAGWDGWYTEAPRSEAWMNQPPNAFPHTSFFKYSGTSALSISKGGGTFTAAAFQEVSDIPAGAIVRGSAFVLLENGSGSNAQVRIGVGSNIGSNVNGAITWSSWMTNLNNYQQISVDHVATGGSVTIVIYATQTWPNDPNAVYIDEASLVIVGEGEAPADSSTGDSGSVDVPAPPAQSAEVGFVAPQDTEEDDGIVHTVGSGDTLASIAVAYGVSVDDLLNLNGLDRGTFLQIGQVIVVSTPEPTEEPEVEAPPVEETAAQPEETSVEPVETEAVEEPTQSFGAVITEFTETPESEPTTEPEVDAESTEDVTSDGTPTDIPNTATPAPTAPVAEAAVQGVNPTELDPGICVRIFEDDNQNGVLEPAEPTLAGGVIVVNDGDGAERDRHTTDGSEPFCFDTLEAGRYTLNVTAPEGYGLTTSDILRVNLEDGATVSVQFGAKAGLEALAIPTVNTSSLTQEPEPQTGTISDDPDISDLSGLLVFGLAGVVLVIGLGASLLLRGR